MKRNITYYRHEADSHRNKKFKMLRIKYGWEGEGRFWALNNIIADQDRCILELKNEMDFMDVATELEMQISEFKEFLNYLIKNCMLVVDLSDGLVIEKKASDKKLEIEKLPNCYTTKDVQEVFIDVIEKRYKNKKDYKRRKQDKAIEQLSHIGDQEEKQTIPAEEFTKIQHTELRDKILKFFNFNAESPKHHQQTVLVQSCINVQVYLNELDYFKEQALAYIEYKKINQNQEIHSFRNWIGTSHEHFLDGAWNQENWAGKLEKIKSKDNKQSTTTYTKPVILKPNNY